MESLATQLILSILWDTWIRNKRISYIFSYVFKFLIISYMITFDVWFYSTHIIGHTPFFWKHLHGEHHDFVEPTAYA